MFIISASLDGKSSRKRTNFKSDGTLQDLKLEARQPNILSAETCAVIGFSSTNKSITGNRIPTNVKAETTWNLT